MQYRKKLKELREISWFLNGDNLIKCVLRGDTAQFFIVFSNFDFGVAMMFIKNVLNKNCSEFHVEQFCVDTMVLR